MAKVNPFQFLQNVRSEAGKVTWATRRETFVTTIMVLIMVFIVAIFLFLVDQIWAGIIGSILN